MSKKEIFQPMIFSLGVYVVWELLGIAAAFFLPMIFGEWQFTLIGNYVYMLCSEIAVFLLFTLLFRKHLMRRDESGGPHCMAGHIWIFLPVLLQIFNDLCTLFSGDIVIDLQTQEGILFTITCFLGTMAVGLAEETVWRRMIFRMILSRWKDSKNGLLYAAFFSALLFGLCHYMNMLTGGQSFADTSMQVFSAVCMGMFLAGIYHRTGKFYIPVFFHGICNFSKFFYE